MSSITFTKKNQKGSGITRIASKLENDPLALKLIGISKTSNI